MVSRAAVDSGHRRVGTSSRRDRFLFGKSCRFFLIEEEGGGLRFILNPTSKKVTCLFVVHKLITCVDTTKYMTKCNWFVPT